MEIIKIIIVDDHQIFRQGLLTLLNKIPFVKVVGEASDGIEFLKLLDTIVPDIVFLDIKMPRLSGIEAAKKAKEKYPHLSIIALTMFGDERYYNEMVSIGVSGFLLKKVEYEELEKAVRTVAEGGTYFSDEHIQHLGQINGMANGNGNSYSNNVRKSNIKLSKREYEILSLLCKGLTTPEIAEKLCVSQRTVEGHRANLMSKTGSKNAISLVLYAIKYNLVNI